MRGVRLRSQGAARSPWNCSQLRRWARPELPPRHGRPALEADQDQDRRREAIEILQESRMMIPDCQRRLEVAHADLTQLLENEKELEEAEEYKEARSILELVKLEA
ncbi:tubulin-specific chaperone A isoform X2 [Nyctibius grandis]|uniref:tubulin-specific chaperone A isoform X2 n=1 Tax=Nyctibius grandis TaxID=48427 RepID=UPI0035BC67C5